MITVCYYCLSLLSHKTCFEKCRPTLFYADILLLYIYYIMIITTTFYFSIIWLTGSSDPIIIMHLCTLGLSKEQTEHTITEVYWIREDVMHRHWDRCWTWTSLVLHWWCQTNALDDVRGVVNRIEYSREIKKHQGGDLTSVHSRYNCLPTEQKFITVMFCLNTIM